ncbi:AmpE protein [Pseudomonas duriflava]|uniref:AmpE protein n=1 Tax=Pseudomonas duriflava TaxID=459528 RepID=A0A562QDW2_9PSED|nr:regulatory signaling modulator protein AmpE [Pseudomonas duriflava]TWI54360.1 AmpE protein [Pseudomonas duriflava]
MTFLVLLLMLGIAWTATWRTRLQYDGWWLALLRETERHMPRRSWLALTVLLVVPLILLMLTLTILQPVMYGWLVLPVHVIVLVYSLGRHDPRAALEGFRDSWQRGDLEAAALRAEQTLGLQAETPEALLNRVQDQLLWRGYQGFFAVIFWYVLLGPLMTLAYRLVVLTAEQTTHPVLRSHALQLAHTLDWIPVRILTGSFAVVGDFLAASRAVLADLFNWDIPAARLLSEAGRASTNVPLLSSGENGAQSLDVFWQLLVRSAVLWYVVVACWTLLRAA